MDRDAGRGALLTVTQSPVSLTTLEMTWRVLIAFLQSFSSQTANGTNSSTFLPLLVPSLGIRRPKPKWRHIGKTEVEFLAHCCCVQCTPVNILQLHSWVAWLGSFHQHKSLSKCAKILSWDPFKIFLSHIATARFFMSNEKCFFGSQANNFKA